MKIRGFIAACLALTTGLYARNAYAEPLFFPTALSETSRAFLTDYLGSDIENFDAAPADLNEDGIPEFILKSRSCDEQLLCLFKVVGNKGGKPVALGDIKAVKLVLAQTSTLGIRDLVAYQNPANDFIYNLYAWDSLASRYKMVR